MGGGENGDFVRHLKVLICVFAMWAVIICYVESLCFGGEAETVGKAVGGITGEVTGEVRYMQYFLPIECIIG